MNSSSALSCNAPQKTRSVFNQNIQVYVRVRPLNSRERCIRSSEVIDVISSKEIVARHSFDSKLTKKFTFDRTFGPESRQAEVYSIVVAPLIEEVLAGYNCTVFAYGQTGTGKTHTMVGTETAQLKSSWEDDSEIGIIPRALSHLFDELRLMDLEFSMRISYLELYNEELFDLLSSEDVTKIRIFDDSTKKGSVIIQGLEEILVHSKDDVYKLLEKGKERRKTTTTLMNAQSSRSHTVFSILVHIRENGIDGEEMLKIGKLNLVDLAGSENVSKAGSEKGIRVREAVNINQSLLTLGRVITALVERTPHIPYRESKLTRLLQESLGGRTKTSIIATVSPGHKDIEETLTTLEYAHRAKNIQNKPELNQKLTKRTVLKEYTEEIDKLKRDLIAARDKNGIYLAEETYNEMTLKMDSQNRELNEKMLLLKALKDELQNKEQIFNEVSLNLIEKAQELKRVEHNLCQKEEILEDTKKTLKSTKLRYKEKKVLLESHVKTEAELRNQATKILEVADCAVYDTHQLQSTIERRKDVDKEIHSTCDRFTSLMRERIANIEDNLKNMQEKQKSYIQMLMEDLKNSADMQNKLLTDVNTKIKLFHSVYEKSSITIDAVNQNVIKTLSALNVNHKSSLENQFEELKLYEEATKQTFLTNLEDLKFSNDVLKNTINTMHQNVTSVLEESSNSLKSYASKLQQQITDIFLIFDNNIKEIALINKEVENERVFEQEHDTVMKEFIEKILSIEQKRKISNENINLLTEHLEVNSKNAIAQLSQSLDFANVYCETTQNVNNTTLTTCGVQIATIDSILDESEQECVKVKKKLNDCSQKAIERINTFSVEETSHLQEIRTVIKNFDAEKEQVFLENKKAHNQAFEALNSSLIENIERLKGHVAVQTEFTNAHQKEFTNFTEECKTQMLNCEVDITKFNQSDLQTYKATGLTPSKREYIYPRVLAATSPHHNILKRMKEDTVDLNITQIIDEEDNENNGIEANIQHNSFDIKEFPKSSDISSTIVIDKTASIGNIYTLQPLQRLNENLMPTSNGAQKGSPSRSSSSDFLNENKENYLDF